VHLYSPPDVFCGIDNFGERVMSFKFASFKACHIPPKPPGLFPLDTSTCFRLQF